MKNSEIKIRISEGDKSKWQNVATNRGLSMTQLIMQGMDSFLSGVPTYYDTSKDVPTRPKKHRAKVEIKKARVDVRNELVDKGFVDKGVNPYSKESQTGWKHVKKKINF